MKHNGLPWRAEELGSIIRDKNGNTVTVVEGENAHAIAVFVACACNAHEELVEALEKFVAVDGLGCECLNCISARAALAKAKGAANA